MHDIAALSVDGVRAAFVASSQFRSATDVHPIQDRTDDELRALADDAYAQVLAALTTG